MPIEKSAIGDIIAEYISKSRPKKGRAGAHPGIKQAQALLRSLKNESMTDLDLFNTVKGFIDNPVEQGDPSAKKAYLRILDVIRKLKTGDSVGSDESTLASLAQCLSQLSEAHCLNEENFQKIMTSPNPATILNKLSELNKNEIQGYFLEWLGHDILQSKVGTHLSLEDKKNLAEIGSKELFRFFRDAIKPRNQEIIKHLKPVFFARTPKIMVELLYRIQQEHPEVGEMLRQDYDQTQLLFHIVRGEINAANALLERKPELLLQSGRTVDFGDRTFLGNGIKALPFAVVARDREMCKMLLGHFDKMENGQNIVASQIDELKEALRNEHTENHRALFSLHHAIEDLETKILAYIEKYGKMEKEEYRECRAEAFAEWKEIRKAQVKLPAWVIEMMCEVGNDVAWVKGDMTQEVIRDSAHLAWLAGQSPMSCACRGEQEHIEYTLLTPTNQRGLPTLLHDAQVLALCKRAFHEDAQLKILDVSDTQSTLGSAPKGK